LSHNTGYADDQTRRLQEDLQQKVQAHQRSLADHTAKLEQLSGSHSKSLEDISEHSSQLRAAAARLAGCEEADARGMKSVEEVLAKVDGLASLSSQVDRLDGSARSLAGNLLQQQAKLTALEQSAADASAKLDEVVSAKLQEQVDKVDEMAQGLAAASAEMSELAATVGQHDSRIAACEQADSNLQTSTFSAVAELSEQISTLSFLPADLNQVQESLASHDAQLQQQQAKLTEMEQSSIDAAAGLDQALEARLQDQVQKLDELSATAAATGTEVSELAAAMAQHGSRITACEQAGGDLQASTVRSAEELSQKLASLSGLPSDLSAVQAAVAGHDELLQQQGGLLKELGQSAAETSTNLEDAINNKLQDQVEKLEVLSTTVAAGSAELLELAASTAQLKSRMAASEQAGGELQASTMRSVEELSQQLASLSGLPSDLSQVQAALAGHDGQLQRQEAILKGLEQSAGEASTSLEDAINSRLQDQVEKLEVLSTTVAAASTELSELAASTAQHESRISACEQAGGELQTSISTSVDELTGQFASLAGLPADLGAVQEAVASHGKQLQLHASQMEGLQQSSAESSSQLNREFEGKLQEHEAQLQAHGSLLQTLGSQQQEHDARLGSLDASGETQGTRVEALEAHLQAHTTQLESLAADLQAAAAQLGPLEENIQAHETQLESLGTDLKVADAKLGSLGVDQHDTAAKLEELEGSMQAQGTQVDALEEHVQAHGSRLESLASSLGALDSSLASQASASTQHQMQALEAHEKLLADTQSTIGHHQQQLDQHDARLASMQLEAGAGSKQVQDALDSLATGAAQLRAEVAQQESKLAAVESVTGAQAVQVQQEVEQQLQEHSAALQEQEMRIRYVEETASSSTKKMQTLSEQLKAVQASVGDRPSGTFAQAADLDSLKEQLGSRLDALQTESSSRLGAAEAAAGDLEAQAAESAAAISQLQKQAAAAAESTRASKELLDDHGSRLDSLVQSSGQLAADVQAAVDGKLQDHGGRVQKLEEHTSLLQLALQDVVAETQQKMTEHSGRLAAHDGKLDALESMSGQQAVELQAAIHAQLRDHTDVLAAHEGKLELLQAAADDTQQVLDTLVRPGLEEAHSQGAELAGQVAEVSSRCGAVEGLQAAAQGVSARHGSLLADHEERLGAMQAASGSQAVELQEGMARQLREATAGVAVCSSHMAHMESQLLKLSGSVEQDHERVEQAVVKAGSSEVAVEGLRQELALAKQEAKEQREAVGQLEGQVAEMEAAVSTGGEQSKQLAAGLFCITIAAAAHALTYCLLEVCSLFMMLPLTMQCG
jgi:chromosome segregation ATPase